MANPSLSERLTTGAKAQGLTLREARSLGYTVGRSLNGPGQHATWRVRARRGGWGQLVAERSDFATCSEALEWIRRIEENGVRS